MTNVKLPDVSKLFSIEAEAAVLGSMLIDPPCIGRVLPRLSRTDAFFLPEHRIIYDAIVRLFIANDPIDTIALRTELKKQGRWRRRLRSTCAMVGKWLCRRASRISIS